ncbi:cytochrome P450 family protein [Rhizoctonia solani 123E]|uniref:Cytochrome P450 family protein n=1 Tax=Rhizoctonia solani 123E TaxID=1423351 RepID=A0A074RPX1_9AGAM|nr:cytochrome P450 family protein [Rhizoctonia solani 123E]
MTSLPLVSLDNFIDYVTSRNLLYLAGSILIIKIAEGIYYPIRKLFSPLRELPGPPNESFIFGNLKRVFAAPNSVVHESWLEKYGSTVRYRGFLSSYRLFTVDHRALAYVMSQPGSFPKPENVRRSLADVLGEGLLFAEGETHKRQRRIMNPAFGPVQVRELVPIFWQKSNKLKDAWLNIIKSSSEGRIVIDVLPWLSRATLDIIGVAGFDYHFNALDGNDEDELSKAFNNAFESGQNFSTLAILQAFVPIFRFIPDERSRGRVASMATMSRIGMKLITEKRAALEYDYKTGSASHGRDLLTLLIKSNMASENEAHMMSDDEVLGQISTFLTAGHETTSTSTTWALYVLTKHPEVQRKLRQELLESRLGDEPSMNDLDKLPYLDNFVKECLRVHPAVPSTVREAAHEVHIPVSKSFRNRHGVEQTHIKMQKGDAVFIPILAMNRIKEIWGDDAKEFKPERWENLPEAAKQMPGVWGHLMTFIHGNRSCIGYRFALIEMKALIYSLVRAIEFNIDPTIEIEAKSSIVTRPRVVSQPEKGNQMPLICTAVTSI